MLAILPLLSLIPFVARDVRPAVTDKLVVDPLLLVKAREVWSVIGRPDNPVWPGWDARKTPILIYFPGKQDLLVNHPNPPAGFHKYSGGLRSPIGPLYVRDGKTVFDLDGQNTSTEVNGVETLVIADTASTRRQWVTGIAQAVIDDPVKANETIEGGLFSDPFDSMVMFAHEAFHVYQRKMARGKAGNESALTLYPSISAENNAGVALEADLLRAALESKSSAECRESALEWLAIRQFRRKGLTREAVAYEDGTEFSEGLAKYVEYRTLGCLQGRKPAPEMWLVPGFAGYADMTPNRSRLLRQMSGFMNGTNIVNNDLYGASSVRFRLYYSGMGVAALLDRLGVDWKAEILQPNTTLTGLAEEALHPTAKELRAALGMARGSEAYARHLLNKQKLETDGKDYIANQMAKLAAAPGELVIDYSKLEKPNVGFSYTPFGILRVDDDRNFYRLIPIRGTAGTASFSENSPRPVLHDRKLKTIHLELTSAPDAASPRRLSGEDLNLPGVELKNVFGAVEVRGRQVVLVLDR